MNIYTVRDNLKNTIAGKENLLKVYNETGLVAYPDLVRPVMIEYLTVNIDELRRILADVEKCCEKATYDSWRENPDRMGGQFTDEEINRANEWR